MTPTDLILHLDGAQLAVHAVLEPLAAVAGAAAVDPGVDEVPAGGHIGVPADPPAGGYLLCARAAVPVGKQRGVEPVEEATQKDLDQRRNSGEQLKAIAWRYLESKRDVDHERKQLERDGLQLLVRSNRP